MRTKRIVRGCHRDWWERTSNVRCSVKCINVQYNTGTYGLLTLSSEACSSSLTVVRGCTGCFLANVTSLPLPYEEEDSPALVWVCLHPAPEEQELTLVDDSSIAACTALVLKPLVLLLLAVELLVPITEELEGVLDGTQGLVLMRFRWRGEAVSRATLWGQSEELITLLGMRLTSREVLIPADGGGVSSSWAKLVLMAAGYRRLSSHDSVLLWLWGWDLQGSGAGSTWRRTGKITKQGLGKYITTYFVTKSDERIEKAFH